MKTFNRPGFYLSGWKRCRNWMLALFCFFCLGTILHGGEMETNLVAAWDFENVVSNRVPDVTGHGHDGLARDAAWLQGSFGTALWIKNEKGFVEVADAPDLQIKEALTLEAWVCPLDIKHAMKIITRVGPEQTGYFMDSVNEGVFSHALLMRELWDPKQFNRNPQPWKRVDARYVRGIVGNWYHVVGTSDKDVMRIFVNGELAGKDKGPTRISSLPGAKLYLGVYQGPGSFPWQGLIDEVRVYNRALTEDEVKLRYQADVERHGITLNKDLVQSWLLKSVIRAEEAVSIPCVLINTTDQKQEGQYHYLITDAKERMLVEDKTASLRLEQKGETTVDLKLPPLPAGEYRLGGWWGDKKPAFMLGEKILVLAKRKPGQLMKDVKVQWRLVDEIDCTQESDTNRYTSLPSTRVLESPIGKYREAGPHKIDRFAYRFKIGKVGNPHLLEFEYPDDKKRTFGVMNGINMDISGGAITGGIYPLTHEFQTQSLLFWPRDERNAIIFMTWGEGLPAAVRNIRIYETDDILPVQAVNLPPEGQERFVGYQFEDPSVELSHGAYRIPEANLSDNNIYGAYEHMAQYLAYTGQNIYKYPLSWYWGPHYRSRYFTSFRQGASLNPDWVQAMLLFFQDYGISYLPSMMLLRLPTLMENAVYDEQAVKSGKPTYNMCLADGGIRASTCDWTDEADDRNTPRHPSGPIFDPIHPEVRSEIRKLFKEILERYADYPNFKGISLNMWATAIIWFYTLENGYGDYDLEQFEKDTQIKVPVSVQDPDRFKKRYEWLIRNKREEWISWRCQQVHSFLMELRDLLTAQRKDLRLQFSIWPWCTPNWKNSLEAEHQLGNRKSVYESHRAGGFDWKMFRNETNVDLELQFTPQHQRERGEGLPERAYFHDFDFVDRDLLTEFKLPPNNGCFIYNSYYETFQIKDPLPGWWFGKEFLNHPGLLLGHKYFMEHYAQAMAALDARYITRGGIGMATIGHDDSARKFARAARALPAAGFSDVSATADIVMARHCRAKQKYYLYLVNREFAPVKVVLSFAGLPRGLIDLAVDEPVSAKSSKLPNWLPGNPFARKINIELEPYEVKALGLPVDGPELQQVIVNVPESVKKWVEDKLKVYREIIASMPEGSAGRTDAEKTLKSIEAMLGSRRYFEAHHLLESYAVQKISSSVDAVPWHVIGPFDNPKGKELTLVYPPEKEMRLDAEYKETGGQTIKWTKIMANGNVDLLKHVGNREHVLAYALAFINCPSERPAQLTLGSDDGIKVWLNDKIVWEHNVQRGLTAGEDKAPVQLKKGMNKLLLKVENRVGGWGFNCYFTRPDGTIMRDLKWVDKP